MPVVIDEFEVVAEPVTTPSDTRGADSASGGAADPRPAQLQQALALWTWLGQERDLRLDDC